MRMSVHAQVMFMWDSAYYLVVGIEAILIYDADSYVHCVLFKCKPVRSRSSPSTIN